MNKVLIVALGVIAAVLLTKTARREMLGLRYFDASEFGAWYPLMSVELLNKLDEFRHRWGYPVIISPAEGGIGRRDDSHSQHNVNWLGEVRAVDVFPTVAGGGYMTTVDQRDRALRLAREVGFTGIGLYTDTQPGDMLHVDVREDREEGDPALWARIGGEYTSIYQVV